MASLDKPTRSDAGIWAVSIAVYISRRVSRLTRNKGTEMAQSTDRKGERALSRTCEGQRDG